MKNIIPFLLFTLLASCSPENITSYVTSTLITSSSASTSTTTSSVVTSSSAVVSSSTSSATPSSSPSTPLANIWLAAMGNINANEFYGVTETLPNTLSSADVVTVHAVYRNNGTLYGYAYEALVDGDGGNKSNRFRLGLVNNKFTGFQSVDHDEHTTFGRVIIQALVNQLAGKDATYDAALQIMVTANATLVGKTSQVTIDGIGPALQAIVTHYLSKI
jgi:hypothetical protein